MTALLVVASATLAQGVVKGAGYLASKNAVSRVLMVREIQGDKSVKVLPDTRILDGDGNPMSFAAIPGPTAGETLVQYEGVSVAGKVEATKIVVSVEPN